MRLAEQRNYVGVLHFFAGIHDQYTVCDLRNHTQVVCDDDDRHIEFFLQLPQQVEVLGLHCDVEGGRRLVSNEERRIERNSHSNHHPSPHASLELMRVVVDPTAGGRDTDEVEQLDGSLPCLGARCRRVSAYRFFNLPTHTAQRVQAR